MQLVEEDFYSSATLAGAAEEIFGALLSAQGKEPILKTQISRTLELLTPGEREVIAVKGNEEKGIANELNFQRNWLKHRMEEDFYNYSDSKREAADLVYRAVCNYMALGYEYSDTIRKFLEWHAEYCSGA